MDKGKKSAFVKKMGKKRLKLTKRQYLGSGGIAGLLGMAGGAGGTGFTTQAGATQQQLENAYNQNQAALANQQQIANTLTPQTAAAVNAQNILAGQYAQQAQGNGPNVAQNVLNQATRANVANQAALMAGQRGAGANPALLARQAAMVGANAQQQAAGQGATMQAQQQIAAEQAGAQLAGNQIAQAQGAANAYTQANQGEQGILQGANTANNNVQGQLANTTMQGQQGLMGGLLKGASGVLGGLFHEGGEVHPHKKLEFVHKMTKMGLEHFDRGTPNGTVGDDNSTEKTGSLAQTASNFFSVGAPKAEAAPSQDEKYEKIREQNRQRVGYDEGGSVSPVQSAQESMRKAFHYADGGGIEVPQVVYQGPQNPFMPPEQVQGGFAVGANPGAEAIEHAFDSTGKKEKPLVSKNLGIMDQNNMADPNMEHAAHGGEMHPHFQGPNENPFANYFMAKGGEVPAMVSPGEVYLEPEQVDAVIHEDKDPLEIGIKFKGKAKVKGDSKKNDTIPATLREGGVVVDREHMGSPEKRKLFVHKAIAKRKVGSR